MYKSGSCDVHVVIMNLAAAFNAHLAHIFNCNLAEAHSACLSAWHDTAIQENLEEFLAGSALDGAYPQARCIFPDVLKCDAGKLTTPAEGISRSTKEGQDDVTKIPSSSEASV